MDHAPKKSRATPHSNRHAEYARRAEATPVRMHARRSNHGPGVLDVFITLISTVAVVAANGAVLLIIGNSLLRGSDYKHTVDIASAAKIGAAGGVFAAPTITIIFAILEALPRSNIVDLFHGFLSDFGDIPLGAMSGYFGVVVLRWFGGSIGEYVDAVGAAWAGALGGVIGVWRKDFNTVFMRE